MAGIRERDRQRKLDRQTYRQREAEVAGMRERARDRGRQREAEVSRIRERDRQR